MKRLVLATAIGGILIAGFAAAGAAKPGPPGHQPAVEQLEAAAKQLGKVEKSLAEVLANGDERRYNPRGLRGRLHAIGNRLTSIERRVQNALDDLPDDPELLSTRARDAVYQVNDAAVQIGDRAHVGFGLPVDSSIVFAALDRVRTLADRITEAARRYVKVVWDGIVPVRFVQVLNCYPWVQTCEPHLEWASIGASVDGLNEAFGEAGVHFMTRSVERYYMFHFAHEAFPVESTLTFDEAAEALGQVFPIFEPVLPAGAPPVADRTAAGWINYMSTIYSDPAELLVWVFGLESLVSREIGHHSVASLPHDGRFVIMSSQNIFDPRRPLQNPPQPALSPNHLTHELGHFFGLAHTWNGPAGINPFTGGPVEWPDLWDLCYCLGPLGLPMTFSSREDAATADCILQPIEVRDPANCRVDNRYGADGSDMACLIQDNFYESGHGLMKGMSFALGTPESPPDSFAWGLNVMGYYGRYNAHIWTPGRFSESQRSLVWGHAHASVPILDPGYGYYPFFDLSSQRDQLLGTD